MERPTPTRYARAGAARIAYQVLGDGPLGLVFARGPASHVEVAWEYPPAARGLRRLASFARLVLFDRRGSGLSDPVDHPPPLEETVEDLRAVVDAVGLKQFALLGATDLGLCAMFAATFPERVTALVLSGATAAGAAGVNPGYIPAMLDAIEADWGQGQLVPFVAPSQIGNPDFEAWFARYERASCSPAMARQLIERRHLGPEVRPILRTIRVPTLVLQRADDNFVPVEQAREVAALIPGARYVELPGTDTYPWSGDGDAWIDEIEHFLTGSRQSRDVDRVLATVVFIDIVDSTSRAAQLGDRRWTALLEEHNAVIRRELARARGREIKSTGDGFLAAFDGPARAVRWAATARGAVKGLGIDLRAGIHTGECERKNDDLAGIAVHIGARIGALAQPGEVLVSSTVKDLVIGSELRFHDRGTHRLRGVPDSWQLYALRSDASDT